MDKWYQLFLEKNRQQSQDKTPKTDRSKVVSVLSGNVTPIFHIEENQCTDLRWWLNHIHKGAAKSDQAHCMQQLNELAKHCESSNTHKLLTEFWTALPIWLELEYAIASPDRTAHADEYFSRLQELWERNFDEWWRDFLMKCDQTPRTFDEQRYQTFVLGHQGARD